MKRTTYAFLLSFALLAAPVGGKAERGQGGGHRGQGRVGAQQQRGEQRMERRAAREDRQEMRSARREAAVERQHRHSARRESARIERQSRRAETTARAEQRLARHQRGRERAERQRERAVSRPVIRQQRLAQQERLERRVERRQGQAIRAERRQQAFARQREVDGRFQRRVARLERLEVRHQQRQAWLMERRARREQQRDLRAVRQRTRAEWQSIDRPVWRQRQALRSRLRAGRQGDWPGPGRFRGLDRNRDAVVTRLEWRGNNRSFTNHDWNGDGVLSGVEVVPGAARRSRLARPLFVERFVPLPRRFVAPVPLGFLPPLPEPVAFLPLPPLHEAFPLPLDEDRLEGVVLTQGFAPVDVMVRQVRFTPLDDVLLEERFLVLDRDADRFVDFDEWSGPRPLFRRLDLDRDHRLVSSELVVRRALLRPVAMVDRERYVAFQLIDRDDDGWIAPWEWTGDIDVFFSLDANTDGVLQQAEYLGLTYSRPVPLRVIATGGLDLDRNGYVSRGEWVGDPFAFVSLDLNGDGRVKPIEAMTIGGLLASQLT